MSGVVHCTSEVFSDMIPKTVTCFTLIYSDLRDECVYMAIIKWKHQTTQPNSTDIGASVRPRIFYPHNHGSVTSLVSISHGSAVPSALHVLPVSAVKNGASRHFRYVSLHLAGFCTELSQCMCFLDVHCRPYVRTAI